RAGTRNVGVIVPWIGLGGMDLIMLELARAMADRPENRVHLMTSESGLLEMRASYATAFTTINPVPNSSYKEQTVRAFMEDMDVLMIANSATAFHYLPAVRARTAPTTLVFIQNVDISADSLSVGFLYPLARQYEGCIDGYVVPSRLTADQIAGFGVPEHKIVVVPNAA
ncbi:unnamed protein product, partial [Phaeothamnion confervicola]